MPLTVTLMPRHGSRMPRRHVWSCVRAAHAWALAPAL